MLRKKPIFDQSTVKPIFDQSTVYKELIMVAINKTMDYFICENCLLHATIKNIIIIANLYFLA